MAQQPQNIDLMELDEKEFKTFIANMNNDLQAFKRAVKDIGIQARQAKDLVTGLEGRIPDTFISRAEYMAEIADIRRSIGKLFLDVESLKPVKEEEDG